MEGTLQQQSSRSPETHISLVSPVVDIKNKRNNSLCQALPLEASLAKGPKQADSALISIYTDAETVKKCNTYNLPQLPALQDITEQNPYASLGPMLICYVLVTVQR